MQEFIQAFGLPVVVVGLLLAALSTFVAFARNYRKCPPNRVLVVFGRKHTGKDQERRGDWVVNPGGPPFFCPLCGVFYIFSRNNFSVACVSRRHPNKRQ